MAERDDIFYSDKMLEDFEVMTLPGPALKALLELVRYSAWKQVDTIYAPPDQDGWIRLTEEQFCRVCRLANKGVWRRIRPQIRKFFIQDDFDGAWCLDRDWICLDKIGWRRPAIPASLRSAVMQRDKFTCGYCSSTDGPFHCDHIVPVANGGATEIENLICACRFCNSSKRDKDADTWIAEGNVVPLRGRK